MARGSGCRSQSTTTGAANELLVDTSDTDLELQEITAARDGLLLYGSSGTGGVLISSSTNQFENVVDGVNLTINDGSLKPVTVSVKTTTSSLVSWREGVRRRRTIRCAIRSTRPPYLMRRT